MKVNLDKLEEFRKIDANVIAVTKSVDTRVMQDLLENNYFHFAENRVNVFLEKYEYFINKKIKWHFIGNLQRNKVKYLVSKIDYLHSLDSLKLAEAIQKELIKQDVLKLDCFIQINLDKVKDNGISPDLLDNFIKSLKDYDRINIVGLMAIMPNTDNFELLDKLFLKMANLKNIYKLERLSMGMSSDYNLALKHGATDLRLGTILFDDSEEAV